MKLTIKETKSYMREVLDAIQLELGRDDIGLEQQGEEYLLTDIDGRELVLNTGEEARIRALAIVMEKLK